MASIKALLSSTLESFLTSKNDSLKGVSMPDQSNIVTVATGITSNEMSVSYTAPCDGWAVIRGGTSNSNGAIRIENSTLEFALSPNYYGLCNGFLPVSKGEVIAYKSWNLVASSAWFRCYFIKNTGL